MWDIESFQNLIHDNEKVRDIQKFLKHIKVRKNDMKEDAGTTWLEIYVIYKRCGYRCLLDDPTNKAMKRPDMKAQVKEFKKLMRHVIEATFMQNETRRFSA